MKKPYILGFYGESNTGKTRLIEKIIKKLIEEKYRVASIKITDKKTSIDKPGKDTYKHSNAGAKIVAFSTFSETSYILKEKQKTSDIVDNIQRLFSADIILIEGVNDSLIPKIRLGNIKKRKNTIHTYNKDFDIVYSMIKEKIQNQKNTQLTIKVNGKNIPLTEFPSEIITNTIIGMLKTLKGVDEEIESVEIKF